MTKTGESDRSPEDLVEERDYLLRSIEDLEREHQAGDVDDADYEVLRASYVTRAAQTLRAISTASADRTSAVQSRNLWSKAREWLGRRRVRRGLVIAAVTCLFLTMLLVAIELAGVRLPGETPSGSVNLPGATVVSEDLTEAQVLASSGNLVEALNVYNSVLLKVPNQPEALTYRGWLERLSGIAAGSASAVRVGDASIASAIRSDPSYVDARGFEVIVLLEDEHSPRLAVPAFQTFIDLKPQKSFLQAIGPQMAFAFHKSNVAVPSGLKPYAS